MSSYIWTIAMVRNFGKMITKLNIYTWPTYSDGEREYLNRIERITCQKQLKN